MFVHLQESFTGKRAQFVQAMRDLLVVGQGSPLEIRVLLEAWSQLDL